jgi:hypothetical protein
LLTEGQRDQSDMRTVHGLKADTLRGRINVDISD